MRSSIFSSKSEAKVIGFVILLMLGAEGTLRTIETSLSVDLKHIREIPAIAGDLAQGADPRVLCLGNSLSRRGLDLRLLETELKMYGVGPMRFRKVCPDASDIWEWFYLFKRHFVDSERIPTFLIVGGGAWHLDDNTEMDPQKLAGHYTGLREVPEVFSRDLTSFHQRVEYLLCFFAKSFSMRERVNRRALDLIIPGYRAAADRINDTLKKQTQGVQEDSKRHTFERLRRLIVLAGSHDVKFIVYLIPTPTFYEIDPALEQLLREENVPLIDCREVAGIKEGNFPDGYHLDEAGAELLTRALAEKLAPVLRSGR